VVVYEVTYDEYARDNMFNFPDIGHAAEAEYLDHGTGLLASQLNASMFLPWGQVNQELPVNQALEDTTQRPGLSKQHRIQLARLHSPEVPLCQFFLGLSWGTFVVLGDLVSPGVSPILIVNSKHPLDLAILTAGIRHNVKLAATPPMSRVLGNTIFPKQIPTTDDECEEFVRTLWLLRPVRFGTRLSSS
jgi:hypothetical protein